MSVFRNIIKKVGQAIWSGVGLEPPEQKRLRLLEAQMEYIRRIAVECEWGMKLLDVLDQFNVAQFVPSWDGVLQQRSDPWRTPGDEPLLGEAVIVRGVSRELFLRLESVAIRRGLKNNDLLLEALQDFLDNDILNPKSDEKVIGCAGGDWKSTVPTPMPRCEYLRLPKVSEIKLEEVPMALDAIDHDVAAIEKWIAENPSPPLDSPDCRLHAKARNIVNEYKKTRAELVGWHVTGHKTVSVA